MQRGLTGRLVSPRAQLYTSSVCRCRRGDDPGRARCNANASVRYDAELGGRSRAPPDVRLEVLTPTAERPYTTGLGPSVEVRAPIVVQVSLRPILTGHGPLRRRGICNKARCLPSRLVRSPHLLSAAKAKPSILPYGFAANRRANATVSPWAFIARAFAQFNCASASSPRISCERASRARTKGSV